MLAIVVCKKCKCNMKLGEEYWISNYQYCRNCYDIVRKTLQEKATLKTKKTVPINN